MAPSPAHFVCEALLTQGQFSGQIGGMFGDRDYFSCYLLLQVLLLDPSQDTADSLYFQHKICAGSFISNTLIWQLLWLHQSNTKTLEYRTPLPIHTPKGPMLYRSTPPGCHWPQEHLTCLKWVHRLWPWPVGIISHLRSEFCRTYYSFIGSARQSYSVGLLTDMMEIYFPFCPPLLLILESDLSQNLSFTHPGVTGTCLRDICYWLLLWKSLLWPDLNPLAKGGISIEPNE